MLSRKSPHNGYLSSQSVVFTGFMADSPASMTTNPFFVLVDFNGRLKVDHIGSPPCFPNALASLGYVRRFLSIRSQATPLACAMETIIRNTLLDDQWYTLAMSKLGYYMTQSCPLCSLLYYEYHNNCNRLTDELRQVVSH